MLRISIISYCFNKEHGGIDTGFWRGVPQVTIKQMLAIIKMFNYIL